VTQRNVVERKERTVAERAVAQRAVAVRAVAVRAVGERAVGERAVGEKAAGEWTPLSATVHVGETPERAGGETVWGRMKMKRRVCLERHPRGIWCPHFVGRKEAGMFATEKPEMRADLVS
jgi:hypothetical protein